MGEKEVLQNIYTGMHAHSHIHTCMHAYIIHLHPEMKIKASNLYKYPNIHVNIQVSEERFWIFNCLKALFEAVYTLQYPHTSLKSIYKEIKYIILVQAREDIFGKLFQSQ